jgi:hypothetical protein
LNALHSALVVAFVSVTALLFVLTLVHRVRVRRVVMTWRAAGRSLPAWPVLFLGAVALLLLYADNTGSSLPISLFVGYLLGGLLWLGSSVLSGSVVVTDYGIVPEIGRPREAIAWMQISDYFEVVGPRRTHFVFMYHAPEGRRERLEIAVPAARAREFKRIVARKLDGAEMMETKRGVGRKALEG